MPRDHPFTVGILVVSDRRSAGAVDETGPRVRRQILKAWPDAEVLRVVVPDDDADIEAAIVAWTDASPRDLVLTCGGTGFAARDVTPEVTRRVIDRPARGLVAAMLFDGLRHTPHAMLSRAEAGIRRRTLVVNLPGSPKGASESLAAVQPALPHAIELLRGDATDASHAPPEPDVPEPDVPEPDVPEPDVPEPDVP